MISRLARNTTEPTLLLFGDRGYADLESLDRRPAPQLALHGSFSLPVSFDVIAEHTRRSGGLVLSTKARQASLHTAAAFAAASIVFTAGFSADAFVLLCRRALSR
jgi:hypothetical protein